MSSGKTLSSSPIGVFDSGVGGLSILIELQKLLPKENFVYLADQAYVPYGEKSKKELVKRCNKIVDYLVKKHNVKMVVIACNTATCSALREVRTKYKFPIVGTVPAIKVATENTRTKTIGVISTPYTAKSKYLHELIKKHGKGIEVINIGCKGLANLVDEGDLNSPEINKLLLKYLRPLEKSKLDQLVIGCTQYPFLKKNLAKILGSQVKLLDSGKAIAKRTRELIDLYSFKNTKKTRGKTLYFTTLNSIKFSNVASSLLKHKVKAGKVSI